MGFGKELGKPFVERSKKGEGGGSVMFVLRSSLPGERDFFRKLEEWGGTALLP